MTAFREFGEPTQEPIKIIDKPKFESLVFEKQDKPYFTKQETITNYIDTEQALRMAVLKAQELEAFNNPSDKYGIRTSVNADVKRRHLE